MARMPTDEERAQLLAALGYLPGNTPQQRLNYLQDVGRQIGFDPFATPFQPEPFPEFEFRPVTREIYASDVNSPYMSIFDDIDRGVNPVNAARAAVQQGAFGDPNVEVDDDYLRDIINVAKDYAKDVKDIQKERAKWERQQAKAAAEAPVSLQEILYPSSALDVMGAQLGAPISSAEDLTRLYAEARRAKAPSRTRETPVAVAPAGAAAAGGAPGFRDVARGVADFGRRQLGRIPGVRNLPVSWNPVPTNPALVAEAGLRAIGATRPEAAAPVEMEEVEIPLEQFMPAAGTDVRSRARRQGFEQAAQNIYGRLGERPVWSPAAQRTMQNLAYMNLISGGRAG